MSYLIGIGISIVGHLCNGLGMNLQKYAHTVSTDKSLIKRPSWQLGMLCLILSEVLNFVALSMNPASIISPLGSFGVIFSTIFGTLFFHESINFKGVIGILLITTGTVLTVITGPSNSKDLTVAEFQVLVKSKTSIIFYLIIASIIIALFIIGHSNWLCMVILASHFAGNSIILSKTLAVFVKLSVTKKNQLANLLPYGILIFMLGCIVLQLRFINKAMETQKSYVVNGLYFSLLNIMTILSATVLFGEMISISPLGKLGFSFGIVMVTCGVFFLSQETQSEPPEEKEPLLPRSSKKRTLSNAGIPTNV